MKCDLGSEKALNQINVLTIFTSEDYNSNKILLAYQENKAVTEKTNMNLNAITNTH